MQRNPPYGNYSFQSYPKTVPPIVGEGDVTAITFPDGSIQFYFIPTSGPNHVPFPYNVNSTHGCFLPSPTNAEVWFVRSFTSFQPNVNISGPPGNFNIILPNTFGECPPYSPPNYYMNAVPPANREYTQKFHNDTWTSTTDIHYFFPSSQGTKYLQYCTETQTEPINQSLQNDVDWKGHCHCGQKSGLNEQDAVNIQNQPKVQFKSSHSCMSVDSESELEQRRSKKYKKNLARNKKNHKDFVCYCKQKIKSTSNKLVTTYTDQATENLVKDGRDTQTKKGIIKTRKPKKPKQATPNIKSSSSSESSYVCDKCAHLTSGERRERYE